VLELENDLQKERQKLGELRKKHYELAGVAEGWEEGEPPLGTDGASFANRTGPSGLSLPLLLLFLNHL
jgi:hypothetical protein